MVRALLGLSLLLLLSACGTTAQFQSSFNAPMHGMPYGAAFGVGPTNASDPRLLDMHFYMDDDATPRWLLMTPQPNR